MTTHSFHQRKDVGSNLVVFAQDHRSQVAKHCGPRCLDPLVAVERPLTSGTFSPSFSSIRVNDAHQHNSSFSSAAKTGFKKVNQGQANLAQFDRLYQGLKVVPPLPALCLSVSPLSASLESSVN